MPSNNFYWFLSMSSWCLHENWSILNMFHKLFEVWHLQRLRYPELSTGCSIHGDWEYPAFSQSRLSSYNLRISLLLFWFIIKLIKMLRRNSHFTEESVIKKNGSRDLQITGLNPIFRHLFTSQYIFLSKMIELLLIKL